MLTKSSLIFMFLLFSCLAFKILSCAELWRDPEAPESIQPLLEEDVPHEQTKQSRTLPVECARVIMLNYPCMDLKAALAECSKDLNNEHNQLKEALFGSMNALLLTQDNGCCTNSKLNRKLKTMPTVKGTGVNVFELLKRNGPSKLLRIMNGYDFIRGIDCSSNQPFLLFVLTSFCTQHIEHLAVAVIFNETGVDYEIIFSYRNPYTTKPSFNCENIVRLMRIGQLVIDLGYDHIRTWIHLKDEASRYKALRSRSTINAVMLFALIVAAVVGINWLLAYCS